MRSDSQKPVGHHQVHNVGFPAARSGREHMSGKSEQKCLKVDGKMLNNKWETQHIPSRLHLKIQRPIGQCSSVRGKRILKAVTHKENVERHLRLGGWTHSINDSFVKGAPVGEATFQPVQEPGCKVSGGLRAAICRRSGCFWTRSSGTWYCCSLKRENGGHWSQKAGRHFLLHIPLQHPLVKNLHTVFMLCICIGKMPMKTPSKPHQHTPKDEFGWEIIFTCSTALFLFYRGLSLLDLVQNTFKKWKIT